jgi:DNA-directed RNA polymerase subunit L
MALSARQQASLDRYLASFTPDITEQMEALGEIADEIHGLAEEYTATFTAVEKARTTLDDAAAKIRQKLGSALDNDEQGGKIDAVEVLDALRDLLTAIDDHGHDIDEIFMEVAPQSDYQGNHPMNSLRDLIIQNRDELADAAQVLDERAGRLGQTA